MEDRADRVHRHVGRHPCPNALRIAEALAGVHLSGAQDQMVRVGLSDGVAVFGEVEVDGRDV